MSGHGHEEVGWEEVIQRKMTSFCLEQESHGPFYISRGESSLQRAPSFSLPAPCRAGSKALGKCTEQVKRATRDLLFK